MVDGAPRLPLSCHRLHHHRPPPPLSVFAEARPGVSRPSCSLEWLATASRELAMILSLQLTEVNLACCFKHLTLVDNAELLSVLL